MKSQTHHGDDVKSTAKRIGKGVVHQAVETVTFSIGQDAPRAGFIGEGEIELEEGEYFCGEALGFPDIDKAEAEGWVTGKIIGYTSPINRREKELLEKYGLSKENFKMEALPEVSSKGTYRTLLSPLRDFSFQNNTFRFSLASGSYATVALREFMDSK